MLRKVDLSSFSTKTFNKRASKCKIIIWYFFNIFFLHSSWLPITDLKIYILRLFGAKIGKNIILKNNINIKSPWNLIIGDNCWIGENVWIDNLDKVTIGNNVCISQGALLLTGNHDYSKSSFNYKNAPIILEDGVWIGAKSVVCPGVIAYSHSILTVGSIATHNMDKYCIYQGNPAIKIRERIIKS